MCTYRQKQALDGFVTVCPPLAAPERYGKMSRGLLFLPAILFLSIIALFCISPAWGEQVTLSTPQSEYFVPVGTDAVLPLTIVSSYDHDVTGTLGLTLVEEGAGSQNASTRTRAFSAFTDERTVSLDVGRADVPTDYFLTISFRYHENGDRSATISGIVIHFVTTPVTPSPGQGPVTSTDSAIALGGSSSSGQTSVPGNPLSSPQSSLVNNQVSQDTRALREELQRTVNQSMQQQDELAGYIAADPVVCGLNRTLSAAGFTPGEAVILPVTNTSGSFTLTYVSGNKKAVISGKVNDTRVPFAIETSQDQVPLPDPLTGNVTFKEYALTVASAGFSLNRTTINATRDLEEIDLAYAGPGNRILHATATIRNGTVVAFEGDNPETLPAFVGPALAFAIVLLLSLGIWYFARFREKELQLPETPAPTGTPRDAALRLLGEADADTRQNRYPEAYRKTGRALRIFLSGTIGDNTELTKGELEQLISSVPGEAGKIRRVLERCEAVGFAKDAPNPSEFQELARSTRQILTDGCNTDTNTNPFHEE